MDTNKFVKAIQLLIKEEVKKEVAKQKKAIKESLLKELNTSKQSVSNKLPDEARGFTPPKKEVFKDNKFSDLLNETAGEGAWRNMEGTPNGVFGANMAQTFMGGGSVDTQMIPQMDSDGRAVDMSKVVDSGVAKALTRDYSGLMKAIDKKKSGML